jgi:hypothetical protein
MTWPIKSLLISIAANLVFLAAAWFWFVFPLMPGLVPAIKICSVFDPGNQPYVAACSGWHGTVAESAGVIMNIALDWGVVWAVRIPFQKHSQRSDAV